MPDIRPWPIACLAACVIAGPAVAQTASVEQIAEIRRQLDELRAEQGRTTARIGQLEKALDQLTGAPATAAAAMPAPSVPAVAAKPAVPPTSRLAVSGDLRLREEFNWSDRAAEDRTRTVLRARLRASYAVNDMVSVGAQMSTGDPDDPNTADVTLSEFVDDQNVSLDQIYARVKLGRLNLYGGKFPLPFRRTDLVWDGDVSPQGVGAVYTLPAGGAQVELRGLYFLLNEAAAGKGSDMLGGQAAVAVPFGGGWKAELSGAYYDYRLRSLAGADAGDFRSNLLRPDGRYLSDFNLGDALLTVSHSGLGERWPIGVTGELVHNFGAHTPADTGYMAELFVGRASRPGDWRFSYGYMAAETDAVFAAFSHDNLPLGTNYRLHALTADHVVLAGTMLNATYYLYRPDAVPAAGLPADWISRLRLNLIFNF